MEAKQIKKNKKTMKDLKLVIEGQKFEWSEEYITGLQVKDMVGAPSEADLYLKIKKPWEDEPIPNDKEVNLARPGIEEFYFANTFYFTLNDEKYRSFKAKVTGEDLLKLAGIKETRCFSLYQKFKGCDFERIAMSGIVDLSAEGIERFITKDPDTFSYTVNGEHEMTDKKFQTPIEILAKAGIDELYNYLVLVTSNGEIEYAWNPEVLIEMDCKGMTFITREWKDVVDIEEYGKSCGTVPPARRYKIKIDKEYHVVSGRYITQNKIIELGGKPDVKYDAYKFLSKSPKPVKLGVEEKVDLLELCLVRFVLQPKEQTEGRGARMEFIVPDEDVEALDQLGLEWETVISGSHWVIINDYPIPEGYNVNSASVALLIPPNYPAGEIDMAYFYPHLSKQNSTRAIGALTNQSIDNKVFQRWSRHRQPGEWRLGIDSIITHLTLVDNWLLNELKK